MAITENDVRLYASERMTDFSDGGGAMSPTVIVDGLDNNVFPDVTDIDRLTGRSSVRKVFGAVVSADTDTYLSAHALIDDAADDSAIDALLLAYGGYQTERAAVLAAMAVAGSNPLGGLEAPDVATNVPFTGTGGSAAVSFTAQAGSIGPGVHIVFYLGALAHLRTVVSYVVTGTLGVSIHSFDAVLDAALPGSGALSGSALRYKGWAGLRYYGVGLSVAGASSGASFISVDSVFSRVVPADPSAPYPISQGANWAVHPSFFVQTHGRAQIIVPGDAVLIHSTVGMTPATVSNAQVVTTGRTSLSRLRVIGNNGVEHARFTLGVPAPSGVGCSADLTAGTVTFTDVSGMSQPVTIEHRIDEMALASDVWLGGGRVTLNRPLSRAYPAGTKVSSLCMLGDLQGRVIGGFAQSAWTGVFSDAVLGGTPTADFNDAVYPLTTTNQGSITDRWTVIFTNTTTFRCIGELTGEISGGSTGVTYAPINPATGAPYFTIPALGWGSGWSAGNVYRFNTSGANAPLWLIRTVAPSVPGGSDSVTVEFRGYVNT